MHPNATVAAKTVRQSLKEESQSGPSVVSTADESRGAYPSIAREPKFRSEQRIEQPSPKREGCASETPAKESRRRQFPRQRLSPADSARTNRLMALAT